jgi:L-ribulokinase
MARQTPPAFLGFDFGTESVRLIAVDRIGQTLASAVEPYQHGQIVPGANTNPKPLTQLPPSFALQHPADWLASAAAASRRVTTALDHTPIAGIGVDFTSCTMLPCRADGTPLCLEHLAIGDQRPSPVHYTLGPDPHAWPKLWKHHGAVQQTARMNEIARERSEPWLARYGGVIGLEWLLPKILEAIEQSPDAANAAQVWLEAGDWFIWQLVGAPAAGGNTTADQLTRSTCQAGYKALWSNETGYPDAPYLNAVHPALAAAVAQKMPGHFVAPDRPAGTLCEPIAAWFGLKPGIPVSAAIIDAHAGVPGAGVGEPDTLVMVMGTSGCHMLLSNVHQTVPGVAGIVPDGILPGFVGYETGQAAMGDAFQLVRKLTNTDFDTLTRRAQTIAPASDGVLCLDWFNGCRTPLMDGSLRGSFTGLTLAHTNAHLFRAALEASAMGLRWIVETLRQGGVPVEHFVATGGLPNKSNLFMQITAAVLNQPIKVHPAPNGPALGAAILAALVATEKRGGFNNPHQAVQSMAGNKSALGEGQTIKPNPQWTEAYDACYTRYRQAGEHASKNAGVFR